MGTGNTCSILLMNTSQTNLESQKKLFGKLHYWLQKKKNIMNNLSSLLSLICKVIPSLQETETNALSPIKIEWKITIRTPQGSNLNVQ